MAMPTIEEALQHLGYDHADAMIEANVKKALAAAIGTVKGAVGQDVEDYLPDDPRTVELVFAYFDDIYDERGVSAKVSGAVRRSVQTMETQLRLELRAKKEAAGA